MHRVYGAPAQGWIAGGGCTIGRDRSSAGQDMTTRIPPLNPLRTFAAAARHLSFTKAAEELFVTAAAVSHQIKVLERSLGVKLFTRAGGTLALTDIGQAYLPAIQQAFKQVIDATNQLHQRKDITTLKINASPTSR